MTNKKYKRVLALLLAMVLLAPSSFGLEKSRVKKEEIIYAGLDFQGRTDLLIAVNGFPRGFKGKDYGKYSQVSNLSTSEELVYDGIKIDIDARENFYYQGKMEARELPWLIEMSWFLDGKRVSEEELLGASGKLKLVYEIKKNPRDKSNYYDYYVLQSSFHFDVDQVTNLQAEQGTLAAAGSTKMVNFMSLPGRGGTYSIEADIRGYEPGMVQIAALPLSMDLDLSELSDYTGDLKTLEMAISQLDVGTWDFLDGLYQLKEGSWAYYRGGLEILDGSYDLSSGLREMSRGSSEIHGGIGEISDGISALSKGSDELGDGLRSLVVLGKGGLGEDDSEEPENLLYASSQFLMLFNLLGEISRVEVSKEDVVLIKEALDFIRLRIIPFINALDEEALAEMMVQLVESLDDVNSSIASLSLVRDALLNPQDYPVEEEEDRELVEKLASFYRVQMEERAGEIDGVIGSLEGLKLKLSLQREILDTFTQLVGNFEKDFLELQRLLGELEKILEDLEFSAEDIQELIDSLDELSGAYGLFHEGLEAYIKEGVEGIYNGVTSGEKSLSQGLILLDQGTQTLYESYGEFNSGLKRLADGLGDFDSGLGTYVNSYWFLHDGLSKLYSGGLELGSGTSQMADETRDIDEKMLEEIKKELDSFTGKGVEFKSFVDYKNKDIASVQFIMLYEGRSLPVEEVDNGVEMEKSFWDRFIDLFKKR